MTKPLRFSIVASITTAFLATSALIPAGLAAVSPDDAGVSMTVQPGTETAPRLRMITRGDIQGERFAAGPAEVIELLLTDGTSLTMAPGTRLTVDSYAYDPTTRSGTLATTLEQGTLRVIGGTLNNTAPITVATPASTLALDNATAVIIVGGDGTTRAGLDYGKSLTVTTAAGDEIEVIKPGFEVTIAADGTAGSPSRRAPGDAVEIARVLNPGLVTGVAPEAGLEPGVVAAEEDVEVADEEEEVIAEVEDDLTDTRIEIVPFEGGDGPGSTGDAGGFDAGAPVGAINTANDLPGQTSTDVRNLAQNRDPRLQEGQTQPDLDNNQTQSDALRQRGLTSNVIFNANEDLAVDLSADGDSAPTRAGATVDDDGTPVDTDLQYVFFGENSERLAIVQEGDEIEVGGFLRSASKGFIGAVIADTLLPEDGGVARDFIGAITGEQGRGLDQRGTPFGSGSYDVLQSGFALVPIDATGGTLYDGYDDFGDTNIVVDRKPDNFFAMEIRPAIVINRDEIKRRFDLDELRTSEALQEEFAEDVGLIIDGNQDRSEAIIEFAEMVLADDELVDEAIIDNFAEVRAFLDTRVDDPQLVPERNETFIFAAGDVDSDPDTGRRLDMFALSPGLDGLNEDGELEDGGTVAPAIRAFLRNATAFRSEDGSGGIPLGDSGVMIIGTPANSVAGLDTDEQSGLLHADIGIDGEGADQRSTVSVTIGHVQYDVDLDARDGFPGEEVVLEGRTVASTQDRGAGASTLAGGELFDTAAGGGRAVDTDGDGAPDAAIPGRASYFVIENFEPDNTERAGGQEKPVGNPDAGTDFAILRLATGTSSTALAPGEGGSFDGVAAGMVEKETGGAEVAITPLVQNFAMTLDPATNRMAVDAGPLQFGGLTGQDSKGQSVYVDDDRFAARTDGADSDAAFVAGRVLQDAAASLPDGNAARDFLDVPAYRHLKWGFFFGDTDTGGADARREHVHLRSWVAGNLTDPSRLPSNGTATYSGHAFGNVLSGQDLYAARGTYTNQWNFGSRAGLAELDFDGASMTGFTRLKDGTVAFDGALSGDARTAGISGVFVRGDEASGQPPAGQFGSFQVQGKSYNAVGTFGAERP